MSAYAKSLIAFGLGVGLVGLGFLLGDDTLRQLGYGALGASPFVFAIPNKTT